MVALLRGVNVGGKAKLAMADLREIATGLGYDDIATYIQSGNLVLSTSKSASAVAKELAGAIASATSVQPAVMVRTRSQLAADLGRQTAAPGTMRNWRTVTTLLAMAHEAAG